MNGEKSNPADLLAIRCPTRNCAVESSGEHPEVSMISSSCTAYAAKLAIEQLHLSIKIKYEVQPPSEGIVEVIYGSHHHCVQADKAICSCTFSKTIGLPCRHLFVAKQKLNLPTFEEFMVQKCWLASY